MCFSLWNKNLHFLHRLIAASSFASLLLLIVPIGRLRRSLPNTSSCPYPRFWPAAVEAPKGPVRMAIARPVSSNREDFQA
mmetsp:Transcript_15245/g.27101  ORF Transcript_15245/g.27101 Transcript_15245/m.27101 type:complete len:80 (+) Transcript_15245:300-539(+)